MKVAGVCAVLKAVVYMVKRKGERTVPLLGFGVAVQHGAAGGLPISEPTIQVTAKASTQQSQAGGGEHTGEIKT